MTLDKPVLKSRDRGIAVKIHLKSVFKNLHTFCCVEKQLKKIKCEFALLCDCRIATRSGSRPAWAASTARRTWQTQWVHVFCFSAALHAPPQRGERPRLSLSRPHAQIPFFWCCRSGRFVLLCRAAIIISFLISCTNICLWWYDERKSNSVCPRRVIALNLVNLVVCVCSAIRGWCAAYLFIVAVNHSAAFKVRSKHPIYIPSSHFLQLWPRSTAIIWNQPIGSKCSWILPPLTMGPIHRFKFRPPRQQCNILACMSWRVQDLAVEKIVKFCCWHEAGANWIFLPEATQFWEWICWKSTRDTKKWLACLTSAPNYHYKANHFYFYKVWFTFENLLVCSLFFRQAIFSHRISCFLIEQVVLLTRNSNQLDQFFPIPPAKVVW